jgi:putative FmdB family regulatory protein
MPTYQYACRTCDHRFEAVQTFHEEALRVCPQCEADDLRKLFGNVGVVFKGSGFYRTDSRNSSEGSGKKSRSSEAAAKSGKSDSSASSQSGGSTKSDTAKQSSSSSGTSAPAKPAAD